MLTYVQRLVGPLKGPRVRDRRVPRHAVRIRLFALAAFPGFHHCGALTVDVLQGGHHSKTAGGSIFWPN